MFSLEQLQQLFRLQLRRSNVRKRIDINDEETLILQMKVSELEKWRVDLEACILQTN